MAQILGAQMRTLRTQLRRPWYRYDTFYLLMAQTLGAQMRTPRTQLHRP